MSKERPSRTRKAICHSNTSRAMTMALSWREELSTRLFCSFQEEQTIGLPSLPSSLASLEAAVRAVQRHCWMRCAWQSRHFGVSSKAPLL